MARWCLLFRKYNQQTFRKLLQDIIVDQKILSQHPMPFSRK